MIKEAIFSLIQKKDLSFEQSKQVMNEIMSGEATEVQMSAYLTALALKGETIDEITGSASGMREHCIKLLHGRDVLEIVGTGGDNSNTFNISTTASFVISAAGIPVAKHGNRAASSRCGAADCLEALGVSITIPPEKSAQLLEKINICFLFAQNYHIAMKYVAPVRRELGFRTVFNILGPLSNPAGANMEVMANLGVQKGMVVYGKDCIDEISMSAETTVCEIKSGQFINYTIKPEDFGMKRCHKKELEGGSPEQNAMITKKILNGQKGAKRDAVVLNAGAGIYVAGKTNSLSEGIALAQQLIDNGKAKAQLEAFIKHSNE